MMKLIHKTVMSFAICFILILVLWLFYQAVDSDWDEVSLQLDQGKSATVIPGMVSWQGRLVALQVERQGVHRQTRPMVWDDQTLKWVSLNQGLPEINSNSKLISNGEGLWLYSLYEGLFQYQPSIDIWEKIADSVQELDQYFSLHYYQGRLVLVQQFYHRELDPLGIRIFLFNAIDQTWDPLPLPQLPADSEIESIQYRVSEKSLLLFGTRSSRGEGKNHRVIPFAYSWNRNLDIWKGLHPQKPITNMHFSQGQMVAIFQDRTVQQWNIEAKAWQTIEPIWHLEESGYLRLLGNDESLYVLTNHQIFMLDLSKMQWVKISSERWNHFDFYSINPQFVDHHDNQAFDFFYGENILIAIDKNNRDMFWIENPYLEIHGVESVSKGLLIQESHQVRLIPFGLENCHYNHHHDKPVERLQVPLKILGAQHQTVTAVAPVTPFCQFSFLTGDTKEIIHTYLVASSDFETLQKIKADDLLRIELKNGRLNNFYLKHSIDTLPKMNLISQLIFLLSGSVITFYIIKVLNKHGVIFMQGVFKQHSELASSANRLKNFGVQLLFLSLVCLKSSSGNWVFTWEQAIESFSFRLGIVLLAMAAIFYPVLRNLLKYRYDTKS